MLDYESEQMSDRLTEARVVSCAMHAAWKEKFLAVVAKAVALAKDESKRSSGKTDVREAFSKLIKLNTEVCCTSCACACALQVVAQTKPRITNLRWSEHNWCSVETGRIRGGVAVLCGEEVCVPCAVKHGK